MDSTTAMLPSSAIRSHSSCMPADKQCNELLINYKRPLTEEEQSLDSEAARKAHNSSSTPHTLHRLSSTDAPDTPTANISWFKHRTSRSRSSSSGDAASLLGSDPGINTTRRTAEQQTVPQNSRSHTGYDRLHSPAQNHLASTGSSSSSSSSFKKQAATCEPSLTTRLKRRIAWSAKVLQRRASCPGDVLLQRKPANSNSSTNSSSTSLADKPCDQQQQLPLLQSHPLCSSQSCPVLRHTHSANRAAEATATASGLHASADSSVANVQTGLGTLSADPQQQGQHVPAVHPQPPGSDGMWPPTPSPAAAQHAPPFGTLAAAMRCATQHFPAACCEITPCDSSSTEGSRGTDASASPEPDDADSAATYPECLFSEGAARVTNSFTSKVYTSSKGQKVAIVRAGSIIMAVFVKESTGEVWECDPDQIAFTGGSSGSNALGADANSAHAAGVIGAGGLLSAEAAAKVYNALNRSSSCGGGSRQRQGYGSCISSSSSVSHCTSSNSRGSWAGRAQSLAGTCSHTSSFKSSVSGSSYPSRRSSRRSTCAGKQQPSGLFAFISNCIAEWQQRRMEQQQRKAAAYLEELEEAAHLAMRVAGCQSFVLPRNWPDSARKQAQEQRRLRVLLTAYRA